MSLSRNTKKKHGKFLPVSYHHTNKHSSFLFSNGLDAFCVSSLASGVARVFLMAHTHTVIIKIALTMGRDGDRRIWCRCSMMKKKKKREGTLWAQMVHQVLKKKNRRLAGPAQVAVRNKCRRGIFFFFKENTRSWRHETGHPSSPLIFSFQCCPGVFLFLSGRVSLCVEECEHLAEAIYSSVRRGSRLRRLAFNMYTENQLSELRDLLCCVAGRKKKKKRVPAVTALDTHRGQVVCVCRCAFLILFSRNHSWPSRLFLSVYIYTPRDKMS